MLTTIFSSFGTWCDVCQAEFFLEFGDELLVVQVTLANSHGDRSSFGFDSFS